MKKMKLFVWAEFYPGWYDGLAFAIAKTEAEARELVAKDHRVGEHCCISDWGPVQVFPLSEARAFSVCGGD